jgi:hypothetical protein
MGKKSFVIDITDTYFEGEKVEGEAKRGKRRESEKANTDRFSNHV